jgi:hypothetical protein
MKFHGNGGSAGQRAVAVNGASASGRSFPVLVPGSTDPVHNVFELCDATWKSNLRFVEFLICIVLSDDEMN